MTHGSFCRLLPPRTLLHPPLPSSFLLACLTPSTCQVRTLQGTSMWRRRHYRVRRGKVPGTFFFTVLDNGVTSEESWFIVDATDDLSWALFYYR